MFSMKFDWKRYMGPFFFKRIQMIPDKRDVNSPEDESYSCRHHHPDWDSWDW